MLIMWFQQELHDFLSIYVAMCMCVCVCVRVFVCVTPLAKTMHCVHQ